MKKYFYLLFIVSIVFFALSSVAIKNIYACDSTKGQITSIATTVGYGEILTINGLGFGQRNLLQNGGNSRYDRWISVFFNNSDYPGGSGVKGISAGNFGGGMNDYEQLPQNSKIVSWSDNKIEINILYDFEHNSNVKSAFSENVNRFSVFVVIDRNPLFANPQNDALVTEICGIPDNGTNSTFTYQPSCTVSTWACGDWGSCSISGIQHRVCNLSFDCSLFPASSPATTQSCTPECLESSWNCDEWEDCASNGTQTRSCAKKYNCEGGSSSPATSQSCTYIPFCVSSDWSCTDWSKCSSSGKQTRTCNKTTNCQGGVSSPATSQSCTYAPQCTSYSWSCDSWSTCLSNGTQTRTCSKNSNCEGGASSPATSKSCTYTPSCTQDTWQCGSWGACSPQGIQTRSCTKTYDCPSVETALPAISQYCEAPNQPKYQTPSDNLEITNQDTIVKATVKLVCPIDRYRASQGSGTVIDSEGTILTNEHVIKNTYGCFVGFIDDYDDEPFFNYTRQIADIEKFSNSTDVAILKLRNPYSRNLTSIDITKGNSNNLNLGDIITTYGYPAKFGTKITYTSGDFSGVNGDYLKTTAILDSGNSGGGAYLKDGTFIGIPSRVSPGNYNIMGEALSINKINSWLNNSAMAYNYGNNNQYSRVSSFLEDFDLSTLDSLSLYIASEEEKYIDNTKSNSQKVTEDERKLITKVDKNLSKRVSGTILLQVEEKGEAWYVYPDNQKKHYLGRPADAFSIMRGLGLGITNIDLNKIPKLDENFIGDYNLRQRLAGKILLQVEENGEAWYIYPNDLKRYYMGRPGDAFNLMRKLGLGITNNDLRKIDVGEVE